MPRTKISRKAAGKRNRKSSTDLRLEATLKDFDAMTDTFINNLVIDYNEINEMVHKVRTITPQNILRMKWSELMEAQAQNYEELNKTHNMTKMNCTATSTLGSLSAVAQEMRKSKKVGSYDEGYLTEDGTNSNRSSNDPASTLSSISSNHGRPLGPLASAVAKSRRRSRSASSHVVGTPLIQNNLLKPKTRATPLMQSQSTHTSRSKYRTPMQSRPQAISADRGIGLITPKVHPNMPLAILRRAKVGETVFSVTGSPVITTAASEDIANVNIPISNGVLSIRPTEMNAADASIVKRFDPVTMEQLKQLQYNLDLIMQAAERANFHMKK